MRLLVDTEAWHSVGAQLRECSTKLDEGTHSGSTAREEVSRYLQMLEEHSAGMTGILQQCAEVVRESTDAKLAITISGIADQIIGKADYCIGLDAEFRGKLGP